MAAKTFNVEIDGYWIDAGIAGIPKYSGVYFVYECIFNQKDDKVLLQRLLYIGESKNVNERIQDHEKYDEWTKLVNKGNTLCFFTGAVEASYRTRVEAAYIFKHKPLLNTEYKTSFPFDTTAVKSTGKTRMLNTNFTVNRT